MNARPRPPLVAWATLAFTLVQSRGLVVAWQHSPLDRFGWLALTLWLAPGVVDWVRHGPPPFDRRSFSSITIAIALLVAGVVTELHLLDYIAAALTVAAVMPPRARLYLWLPGAISWMPLLSWAAKGLPTDGIVALRLVIAVAAASAPFFPSHRPSSPP